MSGEPFMCFRLSNKYSILEERQYREACEGLDLEPDRLCGLLGVQSWANY